MAGIRKSVPPGSCDSKVCAHVSDSSSDLHSWLPTQAMVPNPAAAGSVPKLGEAGAAHKPPAAAKMVPPKRAEGTLHTGGLPGNCAGQSHCDHRLLNPLAVFNIINFN